MISNSIENKSPENKNVSQPNFYEEYPKHTPKTLALGRHILTLTQIAHKFNGKANLISTDNNGFLTEEFEIRIRRNNIPIELVNLLKQCGYRIKDIEKDINNIDIILSIRTNKMGLNWFLPFPFPEK